MPWLPGYSWTQKSFSYSLSNTRLESWVIFPPRAQDKRGEVMRLLKIQQIPVTTDLRSITCWPQTTTHIRFNRCNVCTSWHLALNGSGPRLDQQQQIPALFRALFIRLSTAVVVLSLSNLAHQLVLFPAKSRVLKAPSLSTVTFRMLISPDKKHERV